MNKEFDNDGEYEKMSHGESTKQTSSQPSHPDDGKGSRADATQRAFLASSGSESRVETYGSDKFQGWQTFDEEELRLIAWAKLKGLYVASSEELTRGYTVKGGATEHDVYLMRDVSDGEKYILRSTIRDSYGHPQLQATAAQYLQRLVDYNEVFIDTPMHLIAVSINPRGNAVIWTRQPYVEGKHFDTMEALNSALTQAGWQKIPKKLDGIYRHLETGIVIADVNLGNVMLDGSGQLRYIDVIVTDIENE